MQESSKDTGLLQITEKRPLDAMSLQNKKTAATTKIIKQHVTV